MSILPTPKHCIFNCSKYDSIRRRANQKFGEIVTVCTECRKTTDEEESTWTAVMEMLRKIVVKLEETKQKQTVRLLDTKAPAKTKYRPSLK